MKRKKELKAEILEILKNPQNELSKDILKITNGGLPIILCIKTCKNIKEVKKAIKELLKEDRITWSSNRYMTEGKVPALKKKDLEFLLNHIEKKGDSFIYDIVKYKD